MKPSLAGLLVFIGIAGCDGRHTSPTQPAPIAAKSSITINGVVREFLPNRTLGLPMRDVTVKAFPKVNGPLLTTATSDANGRFSFDVSLPQSGSGVSAIPQIYMTLHKGEFFGAEALLKNVSENQAPEIGFSPALSTLNGTVTNDVGTPLAGASVEILTGSNKGLKTMTDVSGQYSLVRIWGDFDVQASLMGYDVRTTQISLDTGISSVSRKDLALTSQVAHSNFTGQLCTVAPPYTWSKCQPGSWPFPPEVHHTFVASRAGTLTLSVSYNYVGDYYPNSLLVRLTCDSQVTFEKTVSTGFVDANRTEQIALPRACAYDIGLSNYIADRKGGDWTTYRVDAGYPK